MKSGIYLIINTINHKEYVGSSQNLKKRQYKHWHSLKNNKHKNPHLQNAWNAYGSSSFHFVVVEYCMPEDLCEREDWWISLLNTMNPSGGYNLRSADRQNISPETKTKLSANTSARRLEVREKMSASRKGRVITPEWRANLSSALKGRVSPNKGKQMSEEQKLKISATKRKSWGGADKLLAKVLGATI